MPTAKCSVLVFGNLVCCRNDDDGSAVCNEEEDSTSTKSTAGTSGGFAGQIGIQKAGNILMEHLVMIFTPGRGGGGGRGKE